MGVFADTVRALTKAATPRFPGGWSSIAWRGSAAGEGDYRKLVGDGSSSSIVEACVLWICRNFPEAPAVVVQTGDDAIPQVIRHPFARKIRWPNPYYSGVLLWYGTLTSWVIDGNAYWLKVRDRLDRVVEFWYVPHWMIEPRWTLDGSDFIHHYDYRPGGALLELEPRDVFHLRYGIDPDNTRKGRSPLRTLFLELGVDQEASRFSATILRNLGVPGVVIAPDKDSKGALDENTRDAIKAKFKQSFSGDGRGDPIVMSKPTSITQFGFSPQNMELGAIRDIPEERVTAVLGIPAAVVGFGTGLQTAKVGATMSELRDQAYENNIIPTQRLVADEMTLQLLPEFLQPGDDLAALEVAFDLSKVRVLQEAYGKLADRQSTLARAGIAMRSEARGAVGLPVRPEDRVFIPSPGVQVIQPDGSVAAATPAEQAALEASAAAAKEREAETAAALELEERRAAERRRDSQADRLAMVEGMREIAKSGQLVADRTEHALVELKAALAARPRERRPRTIEKEVVARDGNGHIQKTRERELVEEEA